MQSEQNAEALPSPEEESLEHAANWNQHEHVSEQLQLEAQNLIDKAGSPGLAKNAIDVIEQLQPSVPNAPVPQLNSIVTQEKSPILAALEKFERALETPVVPGELTAWTGDAKGLCDKIGELLQTYVVQKHTESFSRILRQDIELGHRVENLREIDSRLLHVDFPSLNQKLGELDTRAPAVQPNESKLGSSVEEVVQEGLAFVIAARTQETAIETWYMEAFTRDCGSGD